VAVITMFRQAGCKGRYIAEEVARTLGYDFADYRTAERLLLQFGFSEVPKVYQSTPDFWDHFTRKGPERDQVNAMLRSVTMAQAQLGNVVLLGRGCFAPLQGLFDVLNVRVKAPLPLRIERVVEDYEMTRDEATAFVREKDELVAAFAPTSYGLSPDAPDVFDVIIDTGKIDPDVAVRFLVDAARSMPGNPEQGAGAAKLQVDRAIADAVAGEFGRLEKLRGEGLDLSGEFPPRR
jgi:cytidylate kinase